MPMNSIRPSASGQPASKGEAKRSARSRASTKHVSVRTFGDAWVVGVGGVGKLVSETLRAAPVLEGSGVEVRVSIVAKEHGKAVPVKGDRKVKA